MMTKTAFFALLNDKENRIGATAHIAVFNESNGNTSLIIRQNGAPNAFLSTHKATTTLNAAFAKYHTWLNEWFMAQTAAAEAQARIDVLDMEAAQLAFFSQPPFSQAVAWAEAEQEAHEANARRNAPKSFTELWCGQFSKCDGCKLQSECSTKPHELVPVVIDGVSVDRWAERTRKMIARELTAQREFDIVQRADGIQYACINEQAVFFRAHRSGTWVRTSVKPELEYFTPAGTERLTDVDTSAPIFTGHNLSEISEYFSK